MKNDRKRKESPHPPNTSVKYYTHPIYSTEANYGYDKEEADKNPKPKKNQSNKKRKTGS